MGYPWTIILPVWIGTVLMLLWIWTGPDFTGRRRRRRG